MNDDLEPLLAATEDAAAFFRRELLGRNGGGPRHYLQERAFAHLLDDTPWTVGFAPGGWMSLREHLATLGYSDDVMLNAGLVTRCRTGNLIDRFRDRITFGIRDEERHLVGFTGRAAPTAPPQVPKYLNSPASTLYDKSAVLFGLGEARPAPESVVITEGPFDALAFDALGDPGHAPLALCGTAITGHHAQKIARVEHGQIVLALDNDAAGMQGLRTALLHMRDMAPRIKATDPSLPGDPADILVSRGTDVLASVVASARPAADVVVDRHIDDWPHLGDSAEASITCLRSAARLLVALPGVDVARQAARLERKLDLDGQTVSRELACAALDQLSDEGTARRPSRVPRRRDSSLERRCPPR